MIVRLGMLQVYSVISVVMLHHDAESAVELRHGAGGGVPIVYHHHVLHICILRESFFSMGVFCCF